MKRLLISGLIIATVGSVALMWYDSIMDNNKELPVGSGLEAAFFETPEQAVDSIRGMLRSENWASLARYYDLSGSGIDRDTLDSGEFFIRTERPEVSHPAGFWRYKHPFPPSFEYAFTTPADEAGIFVVRVSISIDQGAGSPAQEGWQDFLMRESGKGFQILPDDAGLIGVEEPLTDPGPPSAGIPEN